MTDLIPTAENTQMPAGWTIGAPAVAPKADVPTPENTQMPPGWTINPPSGASISNPTTSKPALGILDDPQYAAPNLTIARASLAPDVNDQIKRYAFHFGVPTSHFGVANGEIVRYIPEKNALAKVVPTVGGDDGLLDKAARAVPYSASRLGPALPMVTGTAAGAAMGPTGASIPAVGAVSTVTDLARQGIDKGIARYVEGSNTDNPLAGGSYDYLNALGHGAMNAGGQALGAGAARLLNRNPLAVGAYDRVAAQDPGQIAATADLEAKAKAQGIDLSAGQLTNLRSLMAQERLLGRYPETQDTIANFTANQRQTQVPDAMRRYISGLTPETGETAIGNFKGAANGIVDDALNARSAQARQLYEQALNKPVPEGLVSDELTSLMKRPALRKAWEEARVIAANEGKDPTTLGVTFNEAGDPVFTETPSWRSLDYMKRGLDQVIQQAKNPITGRIEGPGPNAVNQARKEFLGILDAANPDYATARLAYGNASDTVNAMLDGGMGVLQKLKDAPDRIQVARRIFDAGNLTPEEVGRMRGMFALSGKLPEWKAGFGSWLSDRLDDAITRSGLNGNIPGQVYRGVWQDPRQQKVIQAALGNSGAEMEGLDNLMQVIRASARGLPEGSPTATDMAAMGSDAGKMMSTGVKLAGKVMSPGAWMHAGEDLAEGYAALRAPEKRIALANALLGGGVSSQLKQLSILSPTSEKAATIAGQILTDAGVIGSGVREPNDFAAPVLRQPQGQR